MITLTAVAGALVTGLFAGWLLTAVYATAAISRHQQRLQRRVRYWQAETAAARYAAAHLASMQAANDGWPDNDGERGLR
jgi:hypothetical protein